MENHEFKHLLNRFEESSHYLTGLTQNLESFYEILENVKTQIKPLDSLKELLTESNIISNLDDVSKKSIEISEKVNSNISSIDDYLTSVDRLSTGYSQNVEKTIANLIKVKELIDSYNREVAPLAKDVAIHLSEISSIDFNDMAESLLDKLLKLKNQLSETNESINNEFQSLSLQNDTYQKMISEKSYEYHKRVTENFNLVKEKQDEYNDKIKELLEIHISLNQTLLLIESNNKAPLGHFKELCNMWAAENIRKSSLKGNRSFKSFVYRILFISVFVGSLLLNFDHFYNNSKWSKKIYYRAKATVTGVINPGGK